jgi:thioredoxin 1
MSALHITDANFESEVLNSTQPVLVDFWAEWCGPCRSLTPTLDALAAEKSGQIKIVKVNVDESPNAPSTYGVRSIPALMIFKGGKVVAQTVGALPKADLAKWIDASI